MFVEHDVRVIDLY